MAILDNNPTFKYVSIKNMIIEFNKEKYPIANFYSNKKYLYWDASQPYQLIETNERKKEVGNRFLMIINDNGVHTLMPNDEYIVTFDGDNPDLIINSIVSIYEDLDGVGDKFTNIETDINGIRQVVGSSVEDKGSVLQKISILEQRDDTIDMSVSKLEKDFSNNKEMSELRENLNKSMIDFNSGLGIFKQDITTYFKDNKINSEEKIQINAHLDMTDNKKSEVIKYVDTVINIMESENQSSNVGKLNSSKTKFLNSIKNLRTYITTAISDNTIVPSEITAVVDLFAKCNNSINELKNTCDECIFLGAGGKISEELARIGIKSDEILLSVSKNENTIINNLSIEKNLLQSNMNNFDDALSTVKKSIHDLVKNGSIDNAGRETISDKITLLDSEKLNIDNKYKELYNSPNLSNGDIKDSLKLTYDVFNVKYSETKTIINNSISDGIVSESELSQIDITINQLSSNKTNLHPKMTQAMDNIQLNINRAEINAAKDELQGNIKDVDNKIGDLEGTMNNAFKDGVLSDAEKLAIKQNLQTISNEKADVDKQYSTVYSNADLIGVPKTNLKSSYDAYISKYNALVTIVNNILNKTGIVDSTDQSKLNNGFNEYRVASGEYSKRINEAIDSIAKKKADDAEKNAKEHTNAQIKIVNDAISLKVSQDTFDKNNQTISSKFTEIKQTTDSISSQVSKKLNSSDLSSKIQQSASDIQIGFNGINDRININPRSMDFTAANGNRDMLLFGGQTCIYNNMDDKFLATIGSVVNDNNTFKGTGFLLSKHARCFTIGRDANWDDVLTNRSPNPTHYLLMDFISNEASLGMTLLSNHINMRGHRLFNVVRGDIQDIYTHGLKDFTSGASMFRCDGRSIMNDMDWSWNGRNLMNPKLYTNAFYFTNGWLAFAQHGSGANIMANGVHWDWQGFNIENANIFGAYGYQAVNNPTPKVFNLRTIENENTFDQIKIVENSSKFRSFSTNDNTSKIDVSNVQNKEEIMLNENHVDLGKLVTLLIKEVKDLKIQCKTLQEEVVNLKKL